MPSYTTSLRLIQPATGEYSGSWGTQVNNGITALVDTSVAGTASITMTTSDYTLSTANGATDEARAMFLVLGGTPGAARNVICPAVSKLYYVTNNTTGGFAQTVKTASGSGISVPNGASMVLRCDGTNVVEAQNALGSIVLNGGTANGVAYLNASKALTTGSGLVFDGTNLGIGTSSPTYKLDVVSSSGTLAKFTRGSISISAFIGASEAFWGTDTNHPLAFTTNGTEKMRLDSSGNLGLGVTPSAWGNLNKALQLSGTGAVSSTVAGNTASRLSHGAYFDNTNWRYTDTSIGAARYEMTGANAGSTHAWFVSAGGTAGNAITFTQAMTLDADGELGIGTTSPSAGLDVRKQETSAYNTARFSNGTDIQFLDVVCGRALTNGTVGGVSSSLVMTLRSSGSSAGHLAFATGNDERARVTQGGDFLVGTSTVVGVGGITLQSITSGFSIVNNNNAAASGYVFQSFRRSSTEIGSITQNGTTAVQYNTTSDRRLKDNIVPAPSASDVIDAIEIVSHDWKSAPDEHVTYGVIAQDLALVAPQAVMQGDDGEEIEKTWGVDYSKLVPMLIKEIQSLRARVAALEQA